MSTRPLTDVIPITVNRQTTTVTRFGFGYALILAEHQKSLNRVETVSKGDWATTLTGLGFTSADEVYTAFSDYFAQSTSPNTGYLGMVNAEEQSIQITAYDPADTYTITVTSAGGTKDYTSLAAGSAALAAAELAGKIQADVATYFVSATDNVDVVECSADPTGTPYTISGSVTAGMGGGGGTISATTVDAWEDPDDALTACLAASDGWYCIVGVDTMGRTVADQKLIADWAESNARLYLVASADANVRDTTATADTSTSIAGYCNANDLKNTSVIFHGSAATEYLEAGWFGVCGSADPGSINWWYQQISSVTVDTDHTGTRRTNMGAKGCSWFEGFGGLNVTQGGYQEAQNGYGDFIDITRVSHWAEVRCRENLASLLVRLPKIPYTQAGADLVTAETVEAIFLEGVENGAFASYTVTPPTVADISTANKALRHLPSVNGTAVLAGSINSAAITLTVTV